MEVPLPVDMRDFEFFYTRLLPAQSCAPPMLMKCPAAHCERWLFRTQDAQKTRLQASAASRHSAKAWILGHAGVLEQEHRTLPRHMAHDLHAVLIQKPVSQRRGACPGTWIESFRIASSLEGGGYGCWLYPAKGSGMYVPVGRTIVFKFKQDAYKGLGSADCSPNSLARRAFAAARPNATRSRSWCFHDLTWAQTLRSRGYDSLQIIALAKPLTVRGMFRMYASELMLAEGACMDDIVVGPCLKEGLVRSGWNAEKGCSCADDRQDMNCKNVELYTHDTAGGQVMRGRRWQRRHHAANLDRNISVPALSASGSEDAVWAIGAHSMPPLNLLRSAHGDASLGFAGVAACDACLLPDLSNSTYKLSKLGHAHG